MLTAQRTIGNDIEGTLYTLAVLTRWKDFYAMQPDIRRAALAIVGSLDDDDQAAQIEKLTNFVRVSLVYRQDPLHSEHITSPDLLIAEIADVAGNGTAPGDCDDHVLLFCALAQSIGIACDAAGVVAPGSVTVNHVIAVVHLPGRDLDVDLCAKSGFQPPYPQKLFAP